MGKGGYMTDKIIIKNKRQGVNIYNVIGNTTELIIKSKKYGDVKFIVDTCFIDLLKEYPWCVRNYRNNFYACANKDDNKNIALHRLITKCPKGLMVDHINHNTLDNRVSNLKICTNKENQHNRKSFEGVRKTDWGYQVQIRVDNKIKCLGTYKTFEEGKEVRIKAENEYRPYTKEINKYGK